MSEVFCLLGSFQTRSRPWDDQQVVLLVDPLPLQVSNYSCPQEGPFAGT